MISVFRGSGFSAAAAAARVFIPLIITIYYCKPPPVSILKNIDEAQGSASIISIGLQEIKIGNRWPRTIYHK